MIQEKQQKEKNFLKIKNMENQIKKLSLALKNSQIKKNYFQNLLHLLI